MLSKENPEIQVNIKEVYRYLGYRGSSPDPEIEEKVSRCLRQVLKDSDLRGMYESYPLVFHGEDCFSIGDITIKSRDLGKNLRGCSKVYLMGATIGVAIDRLIARSAVRDLVDAAIYQAIGAAYIEDYCDYINEEIRKQANEEGLTIKPRFSPGYGDLGLEYQREIFALLNLPKHVGISLSESLIMSPSKSVTAIIGAASTSKGGGEDEGEGDKAPRNHKCSECPMTSCRFREE